MRFVTGILLLVPLIAIAETAYVTDNLRLRLYADAELSSVIDTLESGDAFEVLSRNSQTALVELPDGRQGYLSAGYIVYEKPARLVVEETAAEVARLTAQLDELEAAFAEPAATLDRLKAENAELTASLAAATERAEALEAENAALDRRQAQYRYSLPYTWVGGAILVCLIAGLLLGLWWADRQSRRRHGGIRVY